MNTNVFKMAARKFQLNGTLMILVIILIFWRQFKPNTYRFEDVNTTDPAYAFMPAKSISFRYMTPLNGTDQPRRRRQVETNCSCHNEQAVSLIIAHRCR